MKVIKENCFWKLDEPQQYRLHNFKRLLFLIPRVDCEWIFNYLKNYPVNWHQRQNRRVSLFRKSTQLTSIEEIIGRNEWITNLFGNIGWNLDQQLSLDIIVLRSIFHTNSSHSSVIFVPTKIVEIKCRSGKNTLLPKKLLIFVNLKNKIPLVKNLKRGSLL